jgi:hypothetical protein
MDAMFLGPLVLLLGGMALSCFYPKTVAAVSFAVAVMTLGAGDGNGAEGLPFLFLNGLAWVTFYGALIATGARYVALRQAKKAAAST